MANDYLHSKAYDDWKCNPPEESAPVSKCKCHYCNDELLPDDEYYELDGEIVCEFCAEEWLEGKKNWVTEDMAYGDER